MKTLTIRVLVISHYSHAGNQNSDSKFNSMVKILLSSVQGMCAMIVESLSFSVENTFNYDFQFLPCLISVAKLLGLE